MGAWGSDKPPHQTKWQLGGDSKRREAGGRRKLRGRAYGWRRASVRSSHSSHLLVQSIKTTSPQRNEVAKEEKEEREEKEEKRSPAAIER